MPEQCQNDDEQCRRIRKKCGHILKGIDRNLEGHGDSHELTVLHADLHNCVKAVRADMK